MSYSGKAIYEIIPEGSYKVIRNCPKCGGKTAFINSNNFRVNANGNQLDVWLIYQCEKCRHTYNLSIYERKKASEFDKKEYESLLANARELAMEYGNRKELFAGNRAEIDLDDIQYRISALNEACRQPQESIMIRNPYELKIRTDRVLAEILNLTRSGVRRLVREGKLSDIPVYTAREMEIFYSEQVK